MKRPWQHLGDNADSKATIRGEMDANNKIERNSAYQKKGVDSTEPISHGEKWAYSVYMNKHRDNLVAKRATGTFSTNLPGQDLTHQEGSLPTNQGQNEAKRLAQNQGQHYFESEKLTRYQAEINQALDEVLGKYEEDRYYNQSSSNTPFSESWKEFEEPQLPEKAKTSNMVILPSKKHAPRPPVSEGNQKHDTIKQNKFRFI